MEENRDACKVLLGKPEGAATWIQKLLEYL
jgi:hypothetical protein